MSDKYYFSKFSSSFNDLLDLIQLENYPGELENGKLISEKWTPKDFANYSTSLYYKYIKVSKEIEESYDQIIHPQLRKYIKKFLENVLCRIVQLKKEIINYNNPVVTLPPVPYIFLDEYLIDLKLEPRDFDLVIPKYFSEDHDDLTQKRMKIVDEMLILKFGNCLPEEDVITNRYFNVEMSFDDAIKILQNLELGRQATKRIDRLVKKESELVGELLAGEESKKLLVENLIAHYKMKKSKYDEKQLLKMQNVEYTDKNKDPLKIVEEIKKGKKEIQKNNKIYYEAYKEDMKVNWARVEENELRENMINERREWISKQIMFNDPKTEGPPYSIKQFYEKDNVEKKVELDENQLKIKENIAKDKLKAKQDDKKKNEKGGMIQVNLFSGPTDEVKNIGSGIEEFKQTFEKPNDYMNNREFVSEKLARLEIIESLEGKVRAQVDDIIQRELTNLRYVFTKGKKDKLPKVPKPKPIKEKMGTGENKIKNVPVEEALKDVSYYKYTVCNEWSFKKNDSIKFR